MTTERWGSPTPEEAARILGDLRVPWWFAGGWAIDLFLGQSHRAHGDLDIGCFRADAGSVVDVLRGWDVRAPVDGVLVPIVQPRAFEASIHNLWCRPPATTCWMLELLFEDSDGPEWVYRRDARIRRLSDEILGETPSGLPYLRPEIQLLYKSKGPRPPDEQDFRARDMTRSCGSGA